MIKLEKTRYVSFRGTKSQIVESTVGKVSYSPQVCKVEYVRLPISGTNLEKLILKHHQTASQ